MHIHLDPVGGIAGDMFLASALDSGICTAEEVETVLSSLGLGEIEIETERVRRGAIASKHISFGGWPPEAESDHRHLSAIIDLLEASGLDPSVRERAVEMFRRLGRAESAIHGIPLEEVHFHECGALDSIFDFVAAAWIIEETGASWSCGPIPLGRGNVETDHGTVPVPVPATAKLLEGLETVTRSTETELITPTGATILRTLAERSPGLHRADGTVAESGYGAGTRDPEGISNVLRMLVLERDSKTSSRDDTPETIVRLVAEIDDMQPEILAAAAEEIASAGALDVVREPVSMKKGRQGTRLSVLGRPEARAELLDAIFRETSTFGVRLETCERAVLEREIRTVETPFGDVEVKEGRWRGERVQVSPEYEDCRQRADVHDVPVQRVYRAALDAGE